ncbi:excinuclease ABC subunit UvrC [Candidatus Uhrbacteria bacterium]|jgi:excinuclease ABC subunit C|nr:excinuclease ABC subunit UvrC [Candidatus Uhrbacteria bacterium]
MIPENIKIKEGQLPDLPGVYFYYGADDELLYIGKATSLKKRVGSYFTKAHDNRIAQLVSRIARIDFIITPTVIEALVLEANQIKAYNPYYNVLLKDDKTFMYLVITNEDYPRPLLMRGQEIERLGINPFDKTLSAKTKKKFLAVYGPFTSSRSLKKSLELIRGSIPWSICQPGRKRPCFDAHIKKCPGVCTEAISKTEYKKTIRRLMLFFDGKKEVLIRRLKKEMKARAKDEEFEEAAVLRRQIFSLEHIQDVALITKEDVTLPYKKVYDFVFDLNGRIEAYDISNISGTSAVGSMVVFMEGQPAKDQYRKFKIKTVEGSDDVGCMEEVMRRRLKRAKQYEHAWALPEVMVIDGGLGQVNRVREVMEEFDVHVPVIGIAKGFDRKQDRLVFDRSDLELARVAAAGKEIFQKARDEAHRFAVKYHRTLRTKASGIKRRKK